jgi:hypothetical protein
VTTLEKLRRVFSLLLEAAKKDPSVLAEIEGALGGAIRSQRPGTAASGLPRNRRKPAEFDPFALYEQGESALRARLAALDIDALKDVVAEYGMDSANLVLKWKTSDRIREHIVVTVQTRSRKGDAFRT